MSFSEDEQQLSMSPVDESSVAVVCALTHMVDERLMCVLASLPKEDYEVPAKREKIKGAIEMVLLGRDMFSFPSGKVEPDERNESAVVREIREEVGLAINQGRVQPLPVQFEVEQERNGKVLLFAVFCYLVHISETELSALITFLQEHQRSVRFFNQTDLLGSAFHSMQLRPSTKQLLNGVLEHHENRVVAK